MTESYFTRYAELARKYALIERALKWYASPENWDMSDIRVHSVIHSPDYGQPGNKARRALERARKVK